jgi:hypothetical protein
MQGRCQVDCVPGMRAPKQAAAGGGRASVTSWAGARCACCTSWPAAARQPARRWRARSSRPPCPPCSPPRGARARPAPALDAFLRVSVFECHPLALPSAVPVSADKRASIGGSSLLCLL